MIVWPLPAHLPLLAQRRAVGWRGRFTWGCCSEAGGSAAARPGPAASWLPAPPPTADSDRPSATAPSEPSSASQTRQHQCAASSVYTSITSFIAVVLGFFFLLQNMVRDHLRYCHAQKINKSDSHIRSSTLICVCHCHKPFGGHAKIRRDHPRCVCGDFLGNFVSLLAASQSSICWYIAELSPAESEETADSSEGLCIFNYAPTSQST